MGALESFKEEINGDENLKTRYFAMSREDRISSVQEYQRRYNSKEQAKDLPEQAGNMALNMASPFTAIGGADTMMKATQIVYDGFASTKEAFVANPFMTRAGRSGLKDYAKGTVQSAVGMVGSYASAAASEAATMQSPNDLEAMGRLHVWGTDAPMSTKLRETIPFIMSGVSNQKLLSMGKTIVGKYTNIDDLVEKAGDEVQAIATKIIQSEKLRPKNQFVADVAGGSFSLLSAIGIATLTGNPSLASSMFAMQTKGQIWDQLRTKDWSDQEKVAVADMGAVITFASEYLGLDFLMNKINGSSALMVGMVSGMSEFVQEFIENESIGVMMDITGAQKQSLEDITTSALYQGFIATFSGGGYGMYKSMTNVSKMQEKLIALGVSNKNVDTVIKGLFSQTKKERDAAIVSVIEEQLGNLLEEVKQADEIIPKEVSDVVENRQEPITIDVSEITADETDAEVFKVKNPEIAETLAGITELINSYENAPESLVKQFNAIKDVFESLGNKDNKPQKNIKRDIDAQYKNGKKITLKENTLLKMLLSRESKGAKRAFALAKQITRDAITKKYNKKIDEIKSKNKDRLAAVKEKIKLQEDLRKDLIAYTKAFVPKQYRGDLLSSINGIKTVEAAKKLFGKIDEKVAEYKRKNTIKKIKAIAEKASKSESIDPVYRKLLNDIYNGINEKNRVQAADDIKEIYKTAIEEGFDVEIPEDTVSNVRNIDLDSMTDKQLNGLLSMVVQLNKIGRNKKKLLNNKKARTVKKAVSLVKESIKESGVDAESIIAGKRRNDQGIDGKSSKDNELGKLNKIDLALSKLENITNKLDGEEEGDIYQLIYEPFYDASNNEIILKNNDMAAVQALMGKYGVDEKGMQKVTTLNGTTYTVMQLMAIYANSKNSDNMDRLTEGHDLSVDDALELANRLPKKYKQYVDGVMEILQSKGELLQAIAYEVDGKIIDLVDEYFPIIYNGEIESLTKDTSSFDYVKNIYGIAKGFIDKRTKSTKKPLSLDFMHIALNHIDKLNHYLTHAATVQDVKKLMADKGVRSYIDAALGNGASSTIDDHVNNIANKSVRTASYTGNTMSAMFEYFKNKFTIATLAYKPVNALIQAMSYGQTITRLGPKAALKGLSEFTMDAGAIVKFIKENSPEQSARPKNLDREIRDALESMQKQGINIDENSFFTMIRTVDMMTVGSTWWSAFRVKMKETEGNKEAAIRYADMEVRRSQPMITAKDMPAIMHKAGGLKFLAAFYSAYSTTYNMLSTKGRKLRIGSDPFKKKLSEALMMLIFTIMAPSMGYKAIKTAGTASLKEYMFAPLEFVASTVPLVGSAFYAATHFGGSNSMPFIAQVGAIFKGVKSAGHLGGDIISGASVNARDVSRTVGAAITAAAYTKYSIPASMMSTALNGVADMIDGNTENPLRVLYSANQLGENKKKK